MQMHNHNLIDSLQDVKEQTDSFDMRVEMPQKLRRRIEERSKLEDLGRHYAVAEKSVCN